MRFSFLGGVEQKLPAFSAGGTVKRLRPLAARSNYRKSLSIVARYFLAMTVIFLEPLQLWAASAPNILLVLIDDQAWNGTSVQMHPDMPNSKSNFYQTPRLEEFAANAMRFYNGYASQSMCSPTRAAILTGKSPAQLQMTDLPISYPGHQRWAGHQEGLPLTPPAGEPLQPDIFSLPQIIKQANPYYTTAHFGKWHLDATTQLIPEDVGYDTSVRKGAYASAEVDPKRVFHLAESANIFIEESVQADKPFFLQLSHYAVHEPVESRPELRDKYAALPPGSVHADPGYAAMTEDLDRSFGMVLDKLDQLGIRDNTYVIYTSDNGAPVGLSSSSPLFRGKSTLREGGIRVPFLVKGPGIAQGSFSDVPVTTTDLYTTIARLAGFESPLPANVEGADLTPVLFNGGSLPEGTDHLSRNFHDEGALYWHWPQNFGPSRNFRVKPSSAIRDGDYKLFLEYGENGGPDSVFLYNITNDISETTNLAGSMPEKTAELLTKLENYLEDVDASFAYDVKNPASMNWDASAPGQETKNWRSTIDLKYKAREIWKLGADNAAPQIQATEHYQPALPSQAFHFDGGDGMEKLFFHVGDRGPRRNTPSPGTPDLDRSASMEFWVRLDSLAHDQILFETGGEASGLSLTVGDADLDGMNNDLRLRILGRAGTNTGAEGVLRDLTITAPLDRFANPLADFIHVAAVFSDNPNDRYAELFVNGASVGRANGLLGADESLRWDDYDLAGLGNMAGESVGGNGGTGPLPFLGGLRGSVAAMRFNNFAVSSDQVLANYNAVLHPVNFGTHSKSGDIGFPTVRPSNVSFSELTSPNLLVMQERVDTLDAPLEVNSLINSATTLEQNVLGTPGMLATGTTFSSYLFHFDPEEIGSGISNVTGSLSFSGQILGVIWESELLAETDSLVGSLGNYGNENTRGFDFGHGSRLEFAPDRQTMTFDLTVQNDSMLQFRVLTTVVNPTVPSADLNGDGRLDSADLIAWQSSYGLNAGADADGDGDTDGRDFLIWQRQYLPNPPPNADFNGDQFVDALDLQIWHSAFGKNDLGDADGDGDTDGRDFLHWQRQFTASTADFNGDGIVDSADLAKWHASYGIDDGGDSNGDRDTDGRDFLAWQRQHTGNAELVASQVSVPEPSSLLLCSGLLAFGLAFRRRVV